MRRQRAALERRARIRTAMNHIIPFTTIGLDLGDTKHAICALNAGGEIIDERTITNHLESLRRLSQKHPAARIALDRVHLPPQSPRGLLPSRLPGEAGGVLNKLTIFTQLNKSASNDIVLK
jgi:hypothetical protein